MSEKLDDLKARYVTNEQVDQWRVAADAIAEIERLEREVDRYKSDLAHAEDAGRRNAKAYEHALDHGAASQWRTGEPLTEGEYSTTIRIRDHVFVKSIYWHPTLKWMDESVKVSERGWTVIAYMPLPKPWKEGE